MTEAPKAAPIVAKVKPVHWHKLPFGKYLMYELNRPGFRIIFFPFCVVCGGTALLLKAYAKPAIEEGLFTRRLKALRNGEPMPMH